MKKVLYAIAALAMTMFAASCAQERLASGTTGDTVMATFTVQLPESVATKAISDGEGATELLFRAFDQYGKHLDLDDKVTVSGKHATVQVALVSGVKYSFLFWAQAENKYTIVYPEGGGASITVDPTTMMNDDSWDAFYYVEKDLLVTEAFNKNISLVRPFAQLNFGAYKADPTNNVRGDFAAAEAAGIVTAATGENTLKTSYTVKVPNTIDLLEGTVSGATDVTLTAANRPGETLTVDGKAYDWVGMAYILAAKDKAVLENVKLTLTTSQNGSELVLERNVPNVPYQANYRTNILGYIFSVIGTYNVTVDPIYNTPDYNVVISNQEQLNSTIAAINDGTSTATSLELDVEVDGTVLDFSELNEPLTIPVTISSPAANEEPKTVVIENLEATQSGDGVPAVTVDAGASLVIESSELVSDAANPRGLAVEKDAEVVINNTTIEVGAGSGGNYPRALQINDTGADVTVSGSTISSPHYPINLIGSSGTATVTMENTTIEGWSILNIWSSGNIFELKNCTLISTNDKTYNADGWNNFAAFVFNKDGTIKAENNTVTITDCSVTVKTTGQGNIQWLNSFTSPTGNVVVFDGNTTITGIDTGTYDADNNYWYMNAGYAGFTLTYGPNVVFAGDWADAEGKNIDRY